MSDFDPLFTRPAIVSRYEYVTRKPQVTYRTSTDSTGYEALRSALIDSIIVLQETKKRVASKYPELLLHE